MTVCGPKEKCCSRCPPVAPLDCLMQTASCTPGSCVCTSHTNTYAACTSAVSIYSLQDHVNQAIWQLIQNDLANILSYLQGLCDIYIHIYVFRFPSYVLRFYHCTGMLFYDTPAVVSDTQQPIIAA